MIIKKSLSFNRGTWANLLALLALEILPSAHRLIVRLTIRVRSATTTTVFHRHPGLVVGHEWTVFIGILAKYRLGYGPLKRKSKINTRMRPRKKIIIYLYIFNGVVRSILKIGLRCSHHHVPIKSHH